MNIKLKSFVWTLPFISFIFGYFTFRLIFSLTKKINVPSVVGLQVKDAVKILSDNNLNTKIIAEKEDADLPDGTIITQTPFNIEIKPLQSVYLTVSKKPPLKKAPQLEKKEVNEIIKLCKKNGIKYKFYYIPSNQTKSYCIAQYPKADSPLEENKVIAYISNNNSKMVIFPNLKEMNLEYALEFLNLYSIKPKVTIDNEHNKKNIIKDQRPIPGSIVDLEKINVQLKV